MNFCRPLIYGDSDFIVVFSASGLDVWCFDDSVCPLGAVPCLPQTRQSYDSIII